MTSSGGHGLAPEVCCTVNAMAFPTCRCVEAVGSDHRLLQWQALWLHCMYFKQQVCGLKHQQGISVQELMGAPRNC